MKIIEAMKRLRVIEKRIDSNCEAINRYAAKTSAEKPYFESDKAQGQEVMGLIQANNDLVVEYCDLKNKINKTNLETVVTIDKKQYSLADLLLLKRKGCNALLKTWAALNDNIAAQRLRSAPTMADGKQAYLERYYDERQKMDEMRKIQDFASEIDSRLEIINATTDLVE